MCHNLFLPFVMKKRALGHLSFPKGNSVFGEEIRKTFGEVVSKIGGRKKLSKVE